MKVASWFDLHFTTSGLPLSLHTHLPSASLMMAKNMNLPRPELRITEANFCSSSGVTARARPARELMALQASSASGSFKR